MMNKLAFLLILLPVYAAFAQQPSSSETLWFNVPAKHWLEALPLGNGRLGAMVYANPSADIIQFNESSLITGNGKLVGFYQPFGTILLNSNLEPISSYKRTLDFNTAVHTLSFEAGNNQYKREVFVSYPDQALVMMLTSSKKRGITTTVRLKDARTSNATQVGDDILEFNGQLENQLSYTAILKLKAKGGTLLRTDSSIQVSQADTLFLYMTAATNLKQSPTEDFLGKHPKEKLVNTLKQLNRFSYAQLKARHVADFSRLYSRVRLNLGPTPNKPSDERLNSYFLQGGDPALEALVFQYGRYLLISSSRIGGFPANLQGIWNNEFKPAWYSQYTTNINVEMNYWLAETTNLSECHFPLFDWVENLAARNRNTSDSVLSVEKGWVAFSTNNILGGSSRWRLHRPGSAWLSQHFWEHYAFTGDKKFLQERTYPLLKELVGYWESHLVKGPGGKLITPDGWSPEHGPGKNEGDKNPYAGTSYDQQIVYDLFENTIRAATVLGEEKGYIQHLKSIRDQLLGPQIGKWGQLQEWMEDVDDSTDHHRHSSHLFAVYPGRQISPLIDQKLASAAERALDARGTISTGWSTAWRLNIRARLLQPEKAHQLIQMLLKPVRVDEMQGQKSGLYPNFFDAHPPFQIDGNFGYTAGITEMLLQSHLGTIHLLPAIPDTWPEGSVSGLKARGNATIGMSWKNGVLQECAIQPAFSGEYVVRYRNSQVKLQLKAGKTYHLNQQLKVL